MRESRRPPPLHGRSSAVSPGGLSAGFFFVSPRRVASPAARRGVLLPAQSAARRGRTPPVDVACALHFSKVLALHSKKVLTLHSKKVLTLHSNGFDACCIFLWDIVGCCRFLEAMVVLAQAVHLAVENG